MSLSPFVLLRDPAAYCACRWDLRTDDGARVYWVEFFKRHITTVLELGVAAAVKRGDDAGTAVGRARTCGEEFVAHFDAFLAAPRSGAGGVTVLTLDRWRDEILRRHGFVDCFIDLKERENEKALALLPAACSYLDKIEPSRRAQAAVEGVFAGNLFDMGAEATAKQFLSGGPDFFSTRARLKPRPWRIDDLDAFAARQARGYRRVIFFIDNAGSDFLLGAIPAMLWLAESGASIVVAANERPTLNDMTIDDVTRWWPRIVKAVPRLSALPIEHVSTGTGEPLIDLACVSPELNYAARCADLVILEGMGRGVESNLDAEMTCDVLNLAMIKDPQVARRIGAELYDCVCRFSFQN